MSSGFGSHPCPAEAECNQYTAHHGGVDFSTGGGTTALAATDLHITATGTNQYQGEYIIGRMTNELNLVMQFHHCQTGSTSVIQGDTVAAGTAPCTEGATGNASSPNVHFQISTEAADDTKPTYDHMPLTHSRSWSKKVSYEPHQAHIHCVAIVVAAVVIFVAQALLPTNDADESDPITETAPGNDHTQMKKQS